VTRAWTVSRTLAAATAVATLAVVSFPVGVAAEDSAVATPVDRQAYTATTPVDACQDSKTSICVAATGQMLTMLAFIRLDLSRLPAGSSPKSARVTLAQDGNPATNVNASAAAFKACVLMVELPPEFNRQNPPPYDCNLAQALAKPEGPGTWSVDLTPLLAIWIKIGNTGAALVANFTNLTGAPAPSLVAPAGWSLAFERSRSNAVGVYEMPADSTRRAERGAAAASVFTSVAKPVTTSPGAALEAVPTGAVVALPSSAAMVVPPPGRAGVVIHAAWLLALLALLAASAGLLAGEASRQLDAGSRTSPVAIMEALAGARSRVAAPLAILWLTALISLGSMGVSR
jgi:hypothetical protein